MTDPGPIRLPRNPAMPALESERSGEEHPGWFDLPASATPDADVRAWLDANRAETHRRVSAFVDAPGFDANGTPCSEFDK